MDPHVSRLVRPVTISFLRIDFFLTDGGVFLFYAIVFQCSAASFLAKTKYNRCLLFGFKMFDL